MRGLPPFQFARFEKYLGARSLSARVAIIWCAHSSPPLQRVQDERMSLIFPKSAFQGLFARDCLIPYGRLYCKLIEDLKSRTFNSP
jgi:hypothetical protein